MDNRKQHLAPYALITGLLVAVLLGLMYWQHARLATALASSQIETSRAAQALVEAQFSDNLRTRADLIAGNGAFVGYVAQALGGALPGMPIDTRSIVDLLEERRGELGLAIAAVLDGQGKLVVATERFSESSELGDEPLFVQARDNQATASGVWADGERLLHVAIRPLAADGSSEGFLLVGMPIEQGIARAVADVAGTDVALVAMTGQGPRIEASTLDPEAENELRLSLAAASTTPASGLVDLDGQRHRVAIAPLFGSDVANLVTVVTSKRGLASSLSLSLPLLVGGALALLLVLVALAAWWRHVIEPADALTRLIDRASTGDYHLKAAEEGGGAMPRLASSFNHLMHHLASR